MQPLQGKNWFLLASLQGGAPLAQGYYMQPCGQKNNPRVLICLKTRLRVTPLTSAAIPEPCAWLLIGPGMDGLAVLRKQCAGS
jgi:hypothetical protein